MMRSIWIAVCLLGGVVPPLAAQADSAISRRPSAISDRAPERRADGRQLTADGRFTRTAVHYGKWLTAAGAGAFTYFAAREHQKSRDEWNKLLAICRSAQDACAIGGNGRYQRSDAEALYQSSRAFDRRANHRLLGAQLSLIATTAMFILDMRAGRQGPDNIPFSPKVSVSPTRNGAAVGLELSF